MEALLYQGVKFIHIMLAVVAVGFNISYGLWLSQAGGDPGKLRFALLGIKLLDDRFANPAYILLMISGAALIGLGRLPITALWLWLSSGLWVVIMVVAYAIYTPALRRQIALLEETGPASAAYAAAAARVRLVGQLLALVVVGILLLMVFKPA